MSKGILKAMRDLFKGWTRERIEKYRQLAAGYARAAMMDHAASEFKRRKDRIRIAHPFVRALQRELGHEEAIRLRGIGVFLVLWWPALAPLTPRERDIVRRDLGLQTRDNLAAAGEMLRTVGEPELGRRLRALAPGQLTLEETVATTAAVRTGRMEA